MTSLYVPPGRAGPSEQCKEFVQRVKTLLGRNPGSSGTAETMIERRPIFAARIQNMPDQQVENITSTILLRWRG
jgi:hypothetical protein